MTNHLKFQVGNIGHACNFVVGTWLSNFENGKKVLRIGEERWEKNGGRV